MKFALVVNLSKERAIKYAKKISLFLLDKNAETMRRNTLDSGKCANGVQKVCSRFPT